jgi:hypothetical protein
VKREQLVFRANHVTKKFHMISSPPGAAPIAFVKRQMEALLEQRK